MKSSLHRLLNQLDQCGKTGGARQHERDPPSLRPKRCDYTGNMRNPCFSGISQTWPEMEFRNGSPAENYPSKAIRSGKSMTCCTNSKNHNKTERKISNMNNRAQRRKRMKIALEIERLTQNAVCDMFAVFLDPEFKHEESVCECETDSDDSDFEIDFRGE